MKYLYAFLCYIVITIVFSYISFRLAKSGQDEWKRLYVAWDDFKYTIGCEIRKLWRREGK